MPSLPLTPDAGPSRARPGRIGIVVIGRNEGERLVRCLASVHPGSNPTVYVDSGSTDGSVASARAAGATVVELDTRTPFTAGRARNEGAAELLRIDGAIDAIQFVDGDCELDPAWLERAADALGSDPAIAIVCGRRRERHPERSVYNRLCDREWNTPVGIAEACGGDFLARASAFVEVAGFTPDLIAGEEPDLCFRLRARGHSVHRIDAAMTLHDAAMTEFRQWWLRNVRSGHATAEALARRGAKGDPKQLKLVASNLFWSLPTSLPLWPVLFARVYRGEPDAAYAASIVVGKLPHAQGQLQYWRSRLRGNARTIIEYK